METFEYQGKMFIKIKPLDPLSCRGCYFDGEPVGAVCDVYCNNMNLASARIFLPYQETKKHSHYFKDVSDLDEIDVYQVLYLFEVTDPCVQHAVKKLLCAGQRGSKDKNKDIQEAIDTLNRYKEINDAS